MIKIENVTKIFPGTDIPAVDNLSMDINEGEVCVLVGPSGCGKTTTMKMINRIFEPTKGKIYVNGQDVSQISPIKLRLGIGYVIQEIGLFPHLNIADNVATVPRELKWPKDKIRKRVDELLTLVGLDPKLHRDRKPSGLSGGQRQRVGVARAMAADPPIMLMDEPFGAVDPITRARLQNEFLRLQEQLKKTIVFVTHDIDEAIKMGDKIAAMREGRLVQYSDPDELLSSPADEFVANLVGRNRSIKRLHLIRAYEAVRGNVPFLEKGDSMERVREKIEDSELRAVLVVDDRQKLIGLVSADDIKKDRGATVAGDLAQEIENYVTDDATLNDALSVMLNLGEGYVAVVDDSHKLKGTITLGDLLEVVKDDDARTAS